MDLLRVERNQIVDQQGQPTRLRGVNIGGWMNMEDFITGFVGAEHRLRAVMAETLGRDKAQFFFDRLLDHFFTEADVAYLKSLGVNAVRLPFNYRHFERDDRPFEYLEDGFERLERAVNWCAKHGVYAILDLHAAQGWQSADWHCDNATRNVMLWTHPHFQERFIALWAELARRYRGNPTVAGYDLLNEPCSRVRYIAGTYQADWAAINALYRRVVAAIRAADPDHILFVEGDNFATVYDGLERLDDNLVCASHHYSTATGCAGPYPGEIDGLYWNRDTQQVEFELHGGTRYARELNIPQFVGECGPHYSGPLHEIPDRLHAAADQLDVFNEAGAHWVMWTYKDIGEMGWLQLDPESPYMQRIEPILQARRRFDAGRHNEDLASPAMDLIFRLEEEVNDTLAGFARHLRADSENFYLFITFSCIAETLQPAYAHLFKGLTETKIDDLLASFALENCRPHPIVDQVVRPRLAAADERR